MSKDFARNSRHPPRHHSSVPGWVWLLTGIVTGAFIMFLVYLSGLTPANKKGTTPAANTHQTADLSQQEKPIFEFYDTLMNNEVIAPPSSTSGDKVNPDAPAAVYMLQVASYRKLSDADTLKAQLTLEGLDTSIAEFNNRGEIYHRVMVGPFTDSEKMAAAKKTLATHNINPIVLQKKPGA